MSGHLPLPVGPVRERLQDPRALPGEAAIDSFGAESREPPMVDRLVRIRTRVRPPSRVRSAAGGSAEVTAKPPFSLREKLAGEARRMRVKSANDSRLALLTLTLAASRPVPLPQGRGGKRAAGDGLAVARGTETSRKLLQIIVSGAEAPVPLRRRQGLRGSAAALRACRPELRSQPRSRPGANRCSRPRGRGRKGRGEGAPPPIHNVLLPRSPASGENEIRSPARPRRRPRSRT